MVFGTSNDEKEEFLRPFKEKIPEPLNSAFKKKRSKEEAIVRRAAKRKSTELFPPSKYFAEIYFIYKRVISITSSKIMLEIPQIFLAVSKLP